MTEIVRSVGYTGNLQRLVWSGGTVSATAYLWGAGGGGGGGDAGQATAGDPGGNGTGGAFSRYSFNLNDGDVLDLAVGGGGGAGVTGQGSAAGGAAGQSLIYNLFNSRNATGSVAVADRRWSPFMNAHAVWANPYVFIYNYSQTVNFPYSGFYTFTYSADDAVNISLDGTLIISYGGFRDNPPPQAARFVSAGNHTVSWSADNRGGDVAGIALTITASFSGGNGSAAGPVPFSGGGGGGGGATVLFRNGDIVAVSGGGAGGGGGGKFQVGTPNAPGTSGRADDGIFAGQNGQSKGGDGGGAGGGGGGSSGGNGGAVQAGDVNGLGGAFGGSAGSSTSNPSGRTPGGNNNEYYPGSSQGGRGYVFGSTNSTAGQNGYAALVLEVPGVFVRSNNQWVPVRNTYVRSSGSWRRADVTNIRSGGSWLPTRGSSPPTFSATSGTWGALPRANS